MKPTIETDSGLSELRPSTTFKVLAGVSGLTLVLLAVGLVMLLRRKG